MAARGIEGITPCHGQPHLAPLRHLVKPDTGHGAEDREPGGHGEQKRGERGVEGEPGDQQTDDGIGDDEEHDVGTKRREVGHPTPERDAQVGERDLADHGHGQIVTADGLDRVFDAARPLPKCPDPEGQWISDGLWHGFLLKSVHERTEGGAMV